MSGFIILKGGLDFVQDGQNKRGDYYHDDESKQDAHFELLNFYPKENK